MDSFNIADLISNYLNSFEQKINKTIFPGMQGGPLEHIIAGKAICFKEADTNEFKEYAKLIVK